MFKSPVKCRIRTPWSLPDDLDLYLNPQHSPKLTSMGVRPVFGDTSLVFFAESGVPREGSPRVLVGALATRASTRRCAACSRFMRAKVALGFFLGLMLKPFLTLVPFATSLSVLPLLGGLITITLRDSLRLPYYGTEGSPQPVTCDRSFRLNEAMVGTCKRGRRLDVFWR